jgi:hypothetical protein
MKLNHILQTFNACQVKYLLIGGMNFALRHQPYTTYDVDLWIEDTDANRAACEQALARLGAEWGRNDDDWGPTHTKGAGWLESQGVFSLHSPFGSIDIFRAVAGLTDWQASNVEAVPFQTDGGTSFRGLSDADMLRCQLALEPAQQKAERIRVLQNLISRRKVDE